MKDRKTLQMQNLINETIRQLSHRFTPSVTMVKHAIERLIEKEYLERNDADRKLLNYLVRLSRWSNSTSTDSLVSNRLEIVCRLHSYPRRYYSPCYTYFSTCLPPSFVVVVGLLSLDRRA